MPHQKNKLLSIQELSNNEVAKIVGYYGASTYRRQLLSLGLTPGVTIKMIRKAPLGDPFEIEFLGLHLCLRRTEASCIQVQLKENI